LYQPMFPSAAQRDRTAIDDAAGLAATIATEAPLIEKSGKVTASVMAGLHDKGLFRLLLPKSVGGTQMHLADFVDVIEELAKADASTAWCVGQASGCSFTAAYVDADVAKDVFGPLDSVLAWGPSTKSAQAVKTDGGYVISGAWMFASGSRNAQWLAGHCPVLDKGGKVQNGPGGRPIEVTALFRKDKASISDVWNVMGLKGTGSDNYSVTDLFIPDAYIFTRDNPADRREDGTLYRFSVINVYGVTFAAVALGIASSMLTSFIDLAARKAPNLSSQLLRDNAAVQQQVGYNFARLQGARAYLHHALEDMWQALQPVKECSMDQRLHLRMVSTYVIQQAREVADFAYHAAGSTAIFASHPFERRFRDMNAVTQQGQSHMANFEPVGAALMKRS
jgi:alkylation response protein AidB-like acyl-CoA dehydrogenase